MWLYIIGLVLLFAGWLLSMHERRDVYRDTWAVLLLVAGVVCIVLRILIGLWRLL